MDIGKLMHGMLLIIALTTDSFVVSFAYGMGKTKMPVPVVAGMNLIMSSLLGVAILAGNFLAAYFPQDLTSGLGTLLLLGIGFYRILGFFFQKGKKEEEAPLKNLTAGEGFVLAFVLSLDSLAVGLGTGLVQSGELLLLTGFFAGGILMMELGWNIGYRFRLKAKRDLSWISGICLLLLAIGSMK